MSAAVNDMTLADLVSDVAVSALGGYREPPSAAEIAEIARWTDDECRGHFCDLSGRGARAIARLALWAIQHPNQP